MNMFRKLNVRVEMVNMGVSFYVPLAMILVMGVYLFLNRYGENWPMQATEIFEYVLSPLAAWWVLYLYMDFFEDHNEELLATLPVSPFFYGVFRVMLLFAVWLLVLIPLIFLTAYLSMDDANPLFLIFRFGSQCFIYCGICFFLIIAFRNVMLPMVVIVGYLSLTFFYKMDWGIVMNEPLYMETGDMTLKLLVHVVIGSLFFLSGHVLLARRMRKMA